MSDEQLQQHKDLSWGMMLAILFGTILVAAGIAFWVVYPFFHQKPH